MAVDPATVKLALQAAAKVVTDEEARKKAFTVVIAPIVITVLIISMFFYILTMPFTMLADFFTGDLKQSAIDSRVEYGYDQRIGTSDENYLENAGLDFSDISFTGGQIEVKYYNQLDARWANLMYGKTSTIGEAGCGPTSLAIAVSTLTNQTIDPVQMCKWAYENGYLCEGSGSYHSLIPEGGRHFGLKVEGCTANEPQRIVDALSSGKLVIAIMGKGTFTSSGHFMVLRGITPEGKILIADPASKRKSGMEWDLQLILNEARKGAAAGGPFWILEAPTA